MFVLVNFLFLVYEQCVNESKIVHNINFIKKMFLSYKIWKIKRRHVDIIIINIFLHEFFVLVVYLLA